jgi:hypothetical protein
MRRLRFAGLATAAGVLVFFANACKTRPDGDARLAAAAGAPDGQAASEAETIVNAFAATRRQLLLELDAGRFPDEIAAPQESLALDDDRGVEEPVPSLADLAAKFASLDRHIAFITSELKNPQSLYHDGLKAKGLNPNAVIEGALLGRLEKVQAYVQKTRANLDAMTRYAAKFHLSLAFLPASIQTKVREANRTLTLLDAELAAVETTINAKELLNAQAASFQNFWQGLQ